MSAIEETTSLLDYHSVNRYWNQIEPSVLGPYMMDGFGFPASAGFFRFRSETRIVHRLIEGLDRDGTVLDLGSGVGYWAEYFSRHFQIVVAVESSEAFIDALKQRCSPRENIDVVHDNVMNYTPEEPSPLMFLGGMLMYLNDADLIALLRRLVPFLKDGGTILCRESTVREGTMTRQGNYQAVYRSVETYAGLFQQCGLTIAHQEPNIPYVLMQTGCEFIAGWKKLMPKRLQQSSLMGRLVYGALRLGNPWIARLPRMMGFDFPKLTNHFFLLKPTGVTNSG